MDEKEIEISTWFGRSGIKYGDTIARLECGECKGMFEMDRFEDDPTVPIANKKYECKRCTGYDDKKQNEEYEKRKIKLIEERISFIKDEKLKDLFRYILK